MLLVRQGSDNRLGRPVESGGKMRFSGAPLTGAAVRDEGFKSWKPVLFQMFSSSSLLVKHPRTEPRSPRPDWFLFQVGIPR